MRAIGLLVLCAGCLDFDPGTPSSPSGSEDMAKPAQMQGAVDMAKPPTQVSHDMAVAPGADLAMGPPAPLGNMLCEANLSITGTYVQGNAPAADFPGGCWPDGTWTFSASVVDNNCTSAPVLEASYQFKVVEDADFNDTITYLNDPNNMYVTTKISGGEGAICTGAFKIFSADGKTVWNLRPALQANNVLNGQGDYRIYDADQRN